MHVPTGQTSSRLQMTPSARCKFLFNANKSSRGLTTRERSMPATRDQGQPSASAVVAHGSFPPVPLFDKCGRRSQGKVYCDCRRTRHSAYTEGPILTSSTLFAIPGAAAVLSSSSDAAFKVSISCSDTV